MPEGSPSSGGPSAPGWREVLRIAIVLVAVILLFEAANRLFPPVAEFFARVPVTIIVLVVGTVLILVSLLRRRPEG